MHFFSFFPALVIAVTLFSPLSGLWAAEEVAKPVATLPLWKQEKITLEAIRSSQKEVQEQLDAIPSDAAGEGVEARKRPLLKKQLELVAELERIVSRVWQLEREAKDRKQRKKELSQALQTEKSLKSPTQPSTPNLKEFEQIKERLGVRGEEVKSILAESESRSRIMQQIPQLLAKAKERRQASQAAIKKLKGLEVSVGGVEERLLAWQVANLHLEDRVALEQTNQWEKEQEDEKEAAPLRELALELARLQYEATEQRFALYEAALKKSQQQALKLTEDQLLEKQKAVESATTPPERILALWESEIARLQNNIADLNQAKTRLLSHISDQEKLLNRDKDDLKNLENLVSQIGSSGPAADILKTAYHRVIQSRQELGAIVGPAFHAQQNQLQARRIELDARLMELRDRWQSDFEPIIAQLKGKELSQFQRQGNLLLDQRRDLLRKEKHLIFDLITEGQRLILMPMEREEALNDLERYVLSRVFWIQDVPPLGVAMIPQLFSEIGGQTRPYSLWNWWKRVLSLETIEGIARILKSWTAILYGTLLFIVIPTTLYRLRIRLYQYVGEQSRRGREQRLKQAERLPILLAWLGGSLLNPVFFLLAAPMVANLDLPASLGPILSALLVYFALFLFLWLLSRSFFAPQGVAVSLFGVSHGVARQFSFSIRLVLTTYLACLVPWLIFQRPPFNFEVFPRIGFLLFEGGVALAIYLLIRPGSPLIKQIFSISHLPDAKPSRQERYWAAISRLAAAFMASILVLDGAGYHFGATYLSTNGLLSLVTVLVLSAISRASGVAIRQLTTHSRVEAKLLKNRAKTESRIQMLKNLLKVWNLVLVGLGLFLVANYWGLNEGAIKSLTDISLFQSTNAEGQVTFVTAADLLVSVAILLFSLWLLRNLSALYETILFPLVRFDDGLRYAVLTISRYLIFLIGAVWITATLQMDLSKVGWVVAAMSVGLGFGLQEIVANFVSGIILLIERPIRVGDMVSIGAGIYGEVTQVNIRSTTVLSRDRQEILVPNKDLISKEVINWTLSDSVVRQKILIGVAYGSDVELVRSVLLEIAAADPDIIDEPPTRALFLNHGESSLDFELRVFLNDPLLRRIVVDRINTAINREFARHKIAIPFPQRDLHIIRAQEKVEAVEEDLQVNADSSPLRTD
ncbi:MAG: mechanosensitive ion channel [Magnetococcales bacterium]|nr:mechanosensitive ion channel [Magnetococcales bacterium]